MIGVDGALKLVRMLNEGQSPGQLAGGLALGFWLGLIPGWPLHVALLLLVIALLNVNLTMAFIGAALAAGLGWLLDPWLDQLGAYVLEDIPALQSLFTQWFNHPIALLTRFNNTVVMGASVAGLIMLPLLFALAHRLIRLYRQRVMRWLGDSRVGKIIKGSKLFKWFNRASRLGEV